MEATGNTEVYFSVPGLPGQRGLNENSTRIVRKDLSKYTQNELNKIANKWDSIPRKSLVHFISKGDVEMAVGTNKLLPTAKI